MTRIAIAVAALTLGLSAAVGAAGPSSPPSAAQVPSAATPVVEVFVGGGYYGGYPYRRYYRPYPWRPWYSYGGPVYYEAPGPAVVIAQPPQPVWTGTGVVWLFPGAPQ